MRVTTYIRGRESNRRCVYMGVELMRGGNNFIGCEACDSC